VTGDSTQSAPSAASEHAVPRGEGILLVAGDGLVTTFSLLGDAVTIGRAPDCDVALAHAALSRHHVRLRLRPTMTVEDLGSRNGTRVRGARIEAGQESALAVGETFQIGKLHFVVARATRGAPSLTSGSARAASLRVVDPTAAAASAFVRDLAASPLSVLLLGETGVGKEVLAQTIHDLSKLRGALVRANCAAMAPSLIESELFGHERAAFTGASQQRVGLLEAAQGGTFFLDEVGELPEAIQVKMLRAIESREITRVGAVKPIALDVRFVAATNRDLALEVDLGRFRSDLFYRLDGITLVIPPLREHRERIGPLALQFLAAAKGAAAKGGAASSAHALDAELLARLEGHDWPGNVRELKAVIERAVVIAGGGPVKARHVTIAPIKASGAPRPLTITTATSEEAIERQRIVDALDACAGNQTRAAKLLGVSRAALVNKIGLHRIQRPRK